MTLTETILRGRSIRKYKPKPIPKKKLKYVLEAGRHVPSWTNRQR